MKIMSRLFIALLAVAPASAAFAADIVTLPPPPVLNLRPATYDWTGVYAGGFVAGACMNGILQDHNSGLDWADAGCGYKGGALVGYNRQFGDIVVGAEADAAAASVMVTNNDPGAQFSAGPSFVGSARLRAGWAMDDNLFYLTGGGEFGQTFVNDFNGSYMTATPFGYVIGGGVEHAVSDHLRVRMEYLYSHFLDTNYSCPTCNLTVQWGDQHEVRAAAIWAF